MTDTVDIQISTAILQRITAEQAWHYSIIPFKWEKVSIGFYCKSSVDVSSVTDELEILFGKQVELLPVDDESLSVALSKCYRKASGSNRQKAKLEIHQSDNFLDKIIFEAFEIQCSDIHIETYEEQCRVRMRIDGKLVERYIVGKTDYPSLINKVKIKANLDIAEKRLPQDGRIMASFGDDKIDIRVSALPTLYGEKIVLRLLSKDSTNIDLASLGFAEKQLHDYLEGVKKTHGIVLISGPTGSGKTTTLYGTLKLLNQEHSNIVTIEDPIEYTLDGINQVQLNEAIGLNFTSALRTFLRQDPDIIMLGEIRDGETAQMAIRAALTGHLVFSTIHTNSAWGTISRLIDMDVPPFLLANTLNLSIAQRLIRVLCPHCKEKVVNLFPKYPDHFKPPFTVDEHFSAVGCEECYYTGFRGRKAVYEVIPIDSELATAIKANTYDIGELLQNRGIGSLADSAFACFAQGATTIEEIYPILMNDI